MPHSELLQCSEFCLLIHQILDGQDVAESYRRGIRSHRETCAECCLIHDTLLQLSAVASEIATPAEYNAADHSHLWNRVLDSVGAKVDEAKPIAKNELTSSGKFKVHRNLSSSASVVGRLDASKIDGDFSSGMISDLAKFLLGPTEVQKFERLISGDQTQIRVNRILNNSYDALLNLQEYVAAQSNVAGTIIVAPDGSVLSSRTITINDAGDTTSMPNADGDELSVWALMAVHNAQAACQFLGHNSVLQLISRTASGFVVIASVHAMNLVVLIDGQQDDAFRVVAKIRTLQN